MALLESHSLVARQPQHDLNFRIMRHRPHSRHSRAPESLFSHTQALPPPPTNPLRHKGKFLKSTSKNFDLGNTSWLDLTPDEPDRPFNFLGLPKEIRLLIYELLAHRVTRQFVINECIIDVSDKCTYPALLSTCRTIYNEAHQIMFNGLLHDGPRLHLTFRGLNVDHLLLICDKLHPSRPRSELYFHTVKEDAAQQVTNKVVPFDMRLFEIRSYMRTPKDHEAHIDWIPTRFSGMSNREFLSRFVWDLGRFYCITANNQNYTVSVLDGESMVPLLHFINRSIPSVYGPEFCMKLSIDGFVTWRDIVCRPAGRRATAYWLWKRH